MLHKKAKPKKVLSILRAEAGEAKLALNNATMRFGRAEVDTLRDHWTVVTRDGLPSVHVEHTFGLTKEGVVVITADPEPDIAPGLPGETSIKAMT